MSVQCPSNMTRNCTAARRQATPMSVLVPDPAANVCLLNTQRLDFGGVPLTYLNLYGQSQAVSALDSAGVQSTSLQVQNPALSTVAATRLMSTSAGQAAVSTHGFSRARDLNSTVMSVTNQTFAPMRGHGAQVGTFGASPGERIPMQHVNTYGSILSSPVPQGTAAGASFLG